MINVSVRIQIVWWKENIIGLWFDNKLIWEAHQTGGIILPASVITTTIFLPFVEAVKFMNIIVNGIACDRISELTIKLEAVVAEAKVIQDKQNKNFEDIEDW